MRNENGSKKWEMRVKLWINKKKIFYWFGKLIYKKMNYYWFNRQKILQKAKEKYSKQNAAKYYGQNK